MVLSHGKQLEKKRQVQIGIENFQFKIHKLLPVKVLIKDKIRLKINKSQYLQVRLLKSVR